MSKMVNFMKTRGRGDFEYNRNDDEYQDNTHEYEDSDVKKRRRKTEEGKKEKLIK